MDNRVDEMTFFERNRLAIGFGAVLFVVIGGGVVSVFLFSGKVPKPSKPQEIMVHLEAPPPLPPPPPPPPPPKTQQPPEQKMVEQPPVKPNEVKPKNEPKIDKPPGPPGPVANGPPSEFGLGGSGNGNGVGGDSDAGGSRFGWYAAQVQDLIADALRRNSKTRDASLRIVVRVWPDANGRITRAELSGSSGDTSVDDAIRNEVLKGLQLQEPPPQDMPKPIVVRISARRPT